jgi:hypothetical protein
MALWEGTLCALFHCRAKGAAAVPNHFAFCSTVHGKRHASSHEDYSHDRCPITLRQGARVIEDSRHLRLA